MYFIKVNDKGEVIEQRHFSVIDESQHELLLQGYIIPSIPDPKKKEGKIPILMWNDSTVYYRYDDVVPAGEEEMLNLKQRLDTQDQVIEEILFTIIPEITEGGI